MKSLRTHLTEYIATRRALGTQLQEPANTLRGFIRFLERRRAKFITIPLALEWSQQSKNVQHATWARKLSMVRQFARWLSVLEPRHQVPPPRLLNVRHRRNQPHIYSDAEIVQLMEVAAALQSSRRLKALTLKTLIGLLAATGLRPGEAAALEDRDVDLRAGVLVIRDSKFGKSRQVPIHETTVVALENYARRRNHLILQRSSSSFFVSDTGTPLDRGTVRRWFCKVSIACGLRKTLGGKRYGRGPRLQDLRHTFATRRLVEWYRAGLNVSVRMPKLAAYLGHASVSCTYWYIEAVPELLQLATECERTIRQGGRR
jgi:integrase